MLACQLISWQVDLCVPGIQDVMCSGPLGSEFQQLLCQPSPVKMLQEKVQGTARTARSNPFLLLQGPSSVNGQDVGSSQAPPEPVKVPQEPMIRDITAGLSIPEEVDELMREHIRFLYREGNAPPKCTATGSACNQVCQVFQLAHSERG